MYQPYSLKFQKCSDTVAFSRGGARGGDRGGQPPVGEKFNACQGIFNGKLCSYAQKGILYSVI